MGDVLRVSLIQTDVVWEDKRANLNKYAAILSHITGDCDLVVFPEMLRPVFPCVRKIWQSVSMEKLLPR